MKYPIVTLLFLLLVIALGAYTTGTYSTTFSDPNRNERQIPVVIYYPIELTEAAESIPYIVFGHGWLMNHSMYSTLTDVLVDLGWIVVFPRTEESLLPDHEEFAKDLSFLSSELLTEYSNFDSILYACISQPAVVMGHSMGGGAAVLAAGMENNFASLITFCAAETDLSAIQGAVNVHIPSLTLSGSADTIAPQDQHQLPIYYNLASEYKAFVSITGAGHLNLYNHTLVSPLLLPWFDFIKTEAYSNIQSFESVLADNSAALSYQIVDNLEVSNLDNHKPIAASRFLCFPNPIHTQTTLCFETKDSGFVLLEIFNVRGQKVRTLVDGHCPAGTHTFVWDTHDQNLGRLASGIYYARLKDSLGYSVSKLLLLH